MTFDFATLETLKVELAPAVAYITLNRPAVRNAMNAKMVEELCVVFDSLRDNRDIRAVILAGAGGTFCAGGDIKEMRENPVPAAQSAHNLDVMLRTVNEAPQVVIAKLEGAVLGGGFGLACVSDIGIASTTAIFGLPEVRLGVVPAFISPFVLQRIGLTYMRELMLTGRRFNGEQAVKYHIASEVHVPEMLDTAVKNVLNEVLQCSPHALAAAKALLFEVKDKPLDETVEYRANLLNQLRQGEEAQEGMLAFLQKLRPSWAVTNEVEGDD